MKISADFESDNFLRGRNWFRLTRGDKDSSRKTNPGKENFGLQRLKEREIMVEEVGW